MSQPDGPVPGLRPGRKWRPDKEAFGTSYTLSELTRWGEAWVMSLAQSHTNKSWIAAGVINYNEWIVDLPESDDPPFQLAEALYDAAK